jgi:hypothetical protein
MVLRTTSADHPEVAFAVYLIKAVTSLKRG